ncbi:hypothetical protein KY284_021220 [Solanum tuberosum]|nr:hypothetical protein KY284_021220 [Solanum tuberosum]
MKYVIKHIPKQPLKFGPTYNSNFNENLVLSIKDEGNGVPRVCNWKVVGAKPKIEMFMENIFTENDCSNVQPTQEEIISLDLPNNSHVPPTQPATSDVNHEEVPPDEVPRFEEFSSKPPEQLLRRSTRFSTTGSTPPPREERLHIQQKIMCPKPHNQMRNRISHFKLWIDNRHKLIMYLVFLIIQFFDEQFQTMQDLRN